MKPEAYLVALDKVVAAIYAVTPLSDYTEEEFQKAKTDVLAAIEKLKSQEVHNAVENLIGKKIVAFRGYGNKQRFGKTEVELAFILFDDQETYLELNEQDPYDYHDCNNSARTMHLWKNKDTWKRMFDKADGFEEPTRLGYDPF